MRRRFSFSSIPAIGRERRRSGFTTVEVVIVSALLLIFGIGMTSFLMMSENLHKSILTQQMSLKDAKTAIETINREIRMSELPLNLVSPYRVEYQQVNSTVTRALELDPGDDGSYSTPWDNTLVLIGDVDGGASPQTIIDDVTPLDANGAFSLGRNNASLLIRLRTGDPVFGVSVEESNNYTGIGLQGVQINIAVGPRN